MRTLLVCLLWTIGFTVFARPAAAADKEIQVLDIASPDAYENARALTGALRRGILRSKGWSVAPGEYSLEVLTAALNCPEIPDQACLEKIAARVKAERFLWGYIKQAGPEHVEAHLHLWQGEGPDKEVKLRYDKSLNDDTDDALLAEAERALTELLGAPTGTLVVTAGSVDGELLIDGMLVGLVKAGKATVEVPSGKVTVMVDAPGYEKLLGTVVVPAGGKATLALDPIPIEETGEEDDEGESAADRPMTDQELWGYIAIGAGAAAALGGAGFWVHSYIQTTDSDFEDYVNDTPSNQDPCQRAHDEGAQNIMDICDSNVTSRTMALVLLPLGVVLGGLGTYLVLSEDDEGDGSKEGPPVARRPRVQPLVGFGRDHGRLDLRVTF